MKHKLKTVDLIALKKVEKEIVSNSKLAYENALVDFVKQVVCKYYCQDLDCLKLFTRRKEIVKVRQVSMYLILKNSKITLKRLGEHFGFNHATVIYSQRTICGYLEFDKDLQKEIDELQSSIFLKAKAIVNNLDLQKDFYFIDLNNFTSLKIDNSKAIILSGYSADEEKKIKKLLNYSLLDKKHENTGMYILEKLKTEIEN